MFKVSWQSQSYADLECSGYDINFSQLITFSNVSCCYSPYDLQCITLILWLEERYETVYTRHPGFQQGSKPLLALDNPFPMDLPDNLFGEKWAFVQLPYSGTC